MILGNGPNNPELVPMLEEPPTVNIEARFHMPCTHKTLKLHSKPPNQPWVQISFSYDLYTLDGI